MATCPAALPTGDIDQHLFSTKGRTGAPGGVLVAHGGLRPDGHGPGRRTVGRARDGGRAVREGLGGVLLRAAHEVLRGAEAPGAKATAKKAATAKKKPARSASCATLSSGPSPSGPGRRWPWPPRPPSGRQAPVSRRSTTRSPSRTCTSAGSTTWSGSMCARCWRSTAATCQRLRRPRGSIAPPCIGSSASTTCRSGRGVRARGRCSASPRGRRRCSAPRRATRARS